MPGAISIGAMPGHILSGSGPKGRVANLSRFTAADATGLASYTPDIGGAWTVVTGAPTIESNKASDNSVDIQATVASGVANCTISVNLTANNDDFQGIVFRRQGASDYMIIGLDNDDNIRHWRQIAAVWDSPNSAAFTVSNATTYALKLVLSGTSMKFYVDGVLYINVSETNFSGATIHGIYTDGVTWNADVNWDEFKIEVP